MAFTHEGQSLSKALLLRLALFVVVVILVWVAYVAFYAYNPDLLGWIYAKLRPITIWLYGLIDNRLPEAVKYKVSAGLSDELGPRALFLLILAGAIEAAVIALFHIVRALRRRLTR